MALNEDEHTPIEVVTIDSSLRTSDGEVFMAAGDARTLEN
jgi:hypothetical protein